MRSDILKFLRTWCPRYRMQANYLPENDVYLIHYNGRAIQGFTTDQFYQVPKRRRAKELLPLMTRGLMINSGEKHKDQLIVNRKLGKRII